MRRKYITVRDTGKIRVNNGYEGIPLEEEIEAYTTNKTPIENTSPIIYTERKDGVKPEYDIRTDRWEIAQNAMDYVSKTAIAKRHNQENKKEDSKAESTQATESTESTD